MNFKQLDIKKVAIAALIVVVLGTFLFLHLVGMPPRWREVMELHEIAYSRMGRFYRSQDDITVYIREDGIWEPFLVLEASYPGEGNGGTLLLRRYLTQERMPWVANSGARLFLETGHRIQYYPMSDIDAWLEHSYIQRFSRSMQNRILIANIEVWDGHNHAPDGYFRIIDVTQTVPRRVFLLSTSETIWMGDRRTHHAVEGEPIAYFNPGRRYGKFQTRQRLTFERRAAVLRYEYKGELRHPERRREEINHSWWLRSAGHLGTIATIMANGMGHYGGLGGYAFSRPAFTLPRNTLIERYEIDGRLVYVIND